MRVAAVNWKLRPIKRDQDFYDHLEELCEQCDGCHLVVLPEMFCLELLALDPQLDERDYPAALTTWTSVITGLLYGWQVERPTILVGGSMILDNKNVCHTVYPSGPTTTEKNVLTEYEKEVWELEPGRGLFLKHGVGVTICLDAEFPASGRALAEAGMLFQCVPAWTETMHGFQRVRWACQARAVENQVCVIHSSLVGRVGKEESHGSSAIIVPPHLPFPDNPILAETPMDEEGVAIAEVDPADLLKCREQGEVRNWRDRDAGDWTVTTV